MRERAVAAFKAIDGEGFARVDFFLPEDGEPVINEINTLPGFTPISMFPRLWELAGRDLQRPDHAHRRAGARARERDGRRTRRREGVAHA